MKKEKYKTIEVIPDNLKYELFPNTYYKLFGKQTLGKLKIKNDKNEVGVYDLDLFCLECDKINFDDNILARYFGDRETKPYLNEEDLERIENNKSSILEWIKDE